MNNSIATVFLFLAGCFVVFGGIGGCMWGYPKYRVYSQTMRGTAAFKEAEINRQIIVEEARAKAIIALSKELGLK